MKTPLTITALILVTLLTGVVLDYSPAFSFDASKVRHTALFGTVHAETLVTGLPPDADELAITAKMQSPEFKTLMRRYAEGLTAREKQLDLDRSRFEQEKKADAALTDFATTYDLTISKFTEQTKTLAHEEVVNTIRQSKFK